MLIILSIISLLTSCKIQKQNTVVLEIPRSMFEDELDDLKYEKGIDEDSDLSAKDLQEVVVKFKEVYQEMNLDFPQDVLQQLQLAST